MKIVSFELTMPNVSSWNGKWSGEGRKYYRIHKFTDAAFKALPCDHLKETNRDSWYYRWQDGWGASVIAQVVDSKEANKRRKVSAGFCGYEWMISSILKRNKILASHEIETV